MIVLQLQPCFRLGLVELHPELATSSTCNTPAAGPAGSPVAVLAQYYCGTACAGGGRFHNEVPVLHSTTDASA